MNLLRSTGLIARANLCAASYPLGGPVSHAVSRRFRNEEAKELLYERPQSNLEVLEEVRQLQIERGEVPYDAKRIAEEKGLPWGEEHFLERLRADGGDKIIVLKRHYLHTNHTRFARLTNETKGLTLQQAFLQIKYLRARIVERMKDALNEGIIQAKEAGFDLNKTYVADVKVTKNGAVLSKNMRKKYIFGRGRYGATPHVKSTLVEIVLQERDKPFLMRTSDPLEWVRERLRQKQEPWVPKVEDMYHSMRSVRPIKPVHC
ncbi:hypothetical protein HDV00_009948 [Rhizophlyctis rosea]|nr:hypothetical protein HDV00_009948 [Rhizophlyctis rosea]